jgi:hypothetical protein
MTILCVLILFAIGVFAKSGQLFAKHDRTASLPFAVFSFLAILPAAASCAYVLWVEHRWLGILLFFASIISSGAIIAIGHRKFGVDFLLTAYRLLPWFIVPAAAAVLWWSTMNARF